jgi:hypothetical protein
MRKRRRALAPALDFWSSYPPMWWQITPEHTPLSAIRPLEKPLADISLDRRSRAPPGPPIVWAGSDRSLAVSVQILSDEDRTGIAVGLLRNVSQARWARRDRVTFTDHIGGDGRLDGYHLDMTGGSDALLHDARFQKVRMEWLARERKLDCVLVTAKK